MKLFVILLLGVAYTTAQWTIHKDDVITIDPTFDAYRDTRLLLQTRANRMSPVRINFRDLNSLNNSPFNRNRPTRVLVHGWWEDDTSDISTETSAALLDLYDFNVIFVDWSEGSQTINYAGAAGRVESVGHFVASQLNWMRDQGFVNFDRVQVVGFSLGAHITGFIGKNTNGQLHTITGLDPAGPLFRERNPSGRINIGDARYVECLHTNGALIGAGIGGNICQADFFPNGGESQPGCLTNTCAHLRAVHLYVESIDRTAFHSVRCTSVTQANRENCNSGANFWFGGQAETNGNIGGITGIFHFATNRNPPYARGPTRPW